MAVPRLAGKVCVINGAASEIGRAVAARFTAEGAVVVGVDRSALDTSLETWRQVHDANLTSIFLSCKHGFPRLRDTDPAGGSVINAASFLAGIERNPGALDKRLVHWPMGRFGTLAEAAGAIAFLASDDSGFITAAALPLDGGITEAFTVPD